jgi:multidrug efflux pump subunit AcrA (membrane-fusion protein)
MSDGYRVSNFSAGSSIYFAVAPTIRPGQHVAAGDTVGTIASSDVQERLVSLQGQLASAERMLAVNTTGDKSALIIAAQQRLDSAKRRREDYQSTIERTRRLFEDNVLPEGEYDRVMSQAHTLDDAIGIEGADLAAAQSGAKPEAIALIESNIAGLKNEIAVISSRAATFTLRAPIAGIVSASSGDNLLSISEVSRYVALIPVRSSDYRRVAATREPAVTITGFSRPVRGRIIAMNHEVEELYGHKVVMATALLDSPPNDLLPGSIARCRIDCTPLAALDYGKFLLHSVATSIEAAGSN